MCLMVMAYRCHPRYPLILASNRDEFLARPTLPAHAWSDGSGIIAGRDREAGGTWLGITRAGRFALLTNHRDPLHPRPKTRSRGLLVTDALRDLRIDPGAGYEGFNLVHGTFDGLRYLNNINSADRPITPGIHTLSNALLDTPWPKTNRARSLFEQAIDHDVIDTDALFNLLKDDQRASDQELPKTGVPLEWERALSPIFISMPAYGTRCSTVITMDDNGAVRFEERVHATGDQNVIAIELLDK